MMKRKHEAGALFSSKRQLRFLSTVRVVYRDLSVACVSVVWVFSLISLSYWQHVVEVRCVKCK